MTEFWQNSFSWYLVYGRSYVMKPAKFFLVRSTVYNGGLYRKNVYRLTWLSITSYIANDVRLMSINGIYLNHYNTNSRENDEHFYNNSNTIKYLIRNLHVRYNCTLRVRNSSPIANSWSWIKSIVDHAACGIVKSLKIRQKL